MIQELLTYVQSWFFITTSILLFIAGLCNAIMDTLQFHFFISIFSKDRYNQSWWNPSISWRNKYVDGDVNKGRTKWFGFITIPILFTDAWHLFKTIELVCFYLLPFVWMIFPTEPIIFLLASLFGAGFRGIAFNYFFNIGLKK